MSRGKKDHNLTPQTEPNKTITKYISGRRRERIYLFKDVCFYIFLGFYCREFHYTEVPAIYVSMKFGTSDLRVLSCIFK